MVERLNVHRPWVTKDPRWALTLHAWTPLLDTKDPLKIGVLCVVTYRHPLSFASSMLKYVSSTTRTCMRYYSCATHRIASHPQPILHSTSYIQMGPALRV